MLEVFIQKASSVKLLREPLEFWKNDLKSKTRVWQSRFCSKLEAKISYKWLSQYIDIFDEIDWTAVCKICHRNHFPWPKRRCERISQFLLLIDVINRRPWRKSVSRCVVQTWPSTVLLSTRKWLQQKLRQSDQKVLLPFLGAYCVQIKMDNFFLLGKIISVLVPF